MTSVEESAPVMTTVSKRPNISSQVENANVPGSVSRGGSQQSFLNEGPDLGDDQSPAGDDLRKGAIELRNQRRYGAMDDQPDQPFAEEEEELGEGEFGKSKIGPWQAGWNVTNAIQVFFSFGFF